MENAMTPLQRAFNGFLLSMPPQQLEDLVKYIQDIKARENGRPLLRNEDTTPQTDLITDVNRAAPVNAGLVTPRPSSARGKRTHEGKRRPLNSFIAFRSYYSVIFPDLTQKAKSGILRFLWQNDPFKAKWTILAKAYSTIRDEYDAEVTLDSFLTLNAELIGILDPVRYLDVMGWDLTDNGQQQYTMAKVKNPVATEAELSTNCSVDDIIKHCYETGYVTEDQRKKETQERRNASVMAFATQPTLIINRNNSLQITGNNTVAAADGNGNVAMEPLSPNPTETTDSPYQNEIVTPIADNTPFGDTDAMMYHGQQIHDAHTNNYLDVANIPLPNWDDQTGLIPYNAAQILQDPFDAFDFNPFLNF
ncbi:mating-type protein MAT alpha 1-domain-containing protein [Aspergillus heterothallicus]